MNADNSSVSTVLPKSPNAKRALIFGVLSIISALTLIGIPFAFLLGVFSLVQSSKAKRAATEQPIFFRQPGNGPMITGITGLILAFILIIPAFISLPLLYSMFLQTEINRTVKSKKALEAQVKNIETEIASSQKQKIEKLNNILAQLEGDLTKPNSQAEKDKLKEQITQTKRQIELLSSNQ